MSSTVSDLPPGAATSQHHGAPSLVDGDKTHGQVTADIAGLVGNRPGPVWWVAFLASVGAFAVGAAAIAYEMINGIGAWGLNRTVGWGFGITNFVFWIGIGHAGTLISAVLFLFRQRWRTSINRAAEAMTIFAVMCAATFPLIHLGRPWYFYWILPYPNNRGSLWVNFRSPLLWDFFAISTYFTISLVFWYIGMIPDLATLRDRAKHRVPKTIFGILSNGWNGSARVWHRYEAIYALLAILATPLVVSVHSIVSMDFATAVVPGWHATIFPPYFVVGAIFSGFAMVLALLLITRRVMKLEAYITPLHLNWMCKIMLLASVVMGASYGIEFFCAWYSGNQYELATFMNRAFGYYAWAYWTMISCNVVIPQALWFSRVRRSPLLMGIVCVVITTGMWFERFVIIVTSLHHDFLPSAWTNYLPTSNEVMILVGMFGLFFALFLLFTRALPIVAIAEIKGVLGHDRPNEALARLTHAVVGQRTGDTSQDGGHGPSPVASSHGDGAAAFRRPIGARGAQRRSRRSRRLFGTERYCIGYFPDEHELLRATEEASRRGYDVLDAFAPYPVHGLPEAMGLGASRLAWIGAWAGAAGLVLGLTLQAWTSSVDWPLRVGGQPFNAWPVFLPVTFELTVLFAGIMGVIALFARTRMWPGNRKPRLRRVTDDRFALALLEVDASMDLDEMKHMLRTHGAVEVHEGDDLA